MLKEPKIYVLLFGEDRENKHSRSYVERVVKSCPNHPINVRDTKENKEYTVIYSGHGDPFWAEIPLLHEERVKTAFEVLIARSIDPEISNLSGEYPLVKIKDDVRCHIKTTEHKAAVETLAAHLNRSDMVLFVPEEVEFFFDPVKLQMALSILSIFSDTFVLKKDLWEKLICFHLSDELSTVQDEWMSTVLQLLDKAKHDRSDAEKECLVDQILNNFCDPTNMIFVWTIDQQLKRSCIRVSEADRQFLITSIGLGLLGNIVGKLHSASSLDVESWRFIKALPVNDYFSLSLALDALPALVEGRRIAKIDISAEYQKMRDQKTPIGDAGLLQRERSGVFGTSPMASRKSFFAKAVGLSGAGSRSGSPKGELLRVASVRSIGSDPLGSPLVMRNGNLAVGLFRRSSVRAPVAIQKPQAAQLSFAALSD